MESALERAGAVDGDEIRIVGRSFEFESARTAEDAFKELDLERALRRMRRGSGGVPTRRPGRARARPARRLKAPVPRAAAQAGASSSR